MIAASAIGLFVIPMLYVIFQNLRERSGAWVRRGKPRPQRRAPISSEQNGNSVN